MQVHPSPPAVQQIDKSQRVIVDVPIAVQAKGLLTWQGRYS